MKKTRKKKKPWPWRPWSFSFSPLCLFVKASDGGRKRIWFKIESGGGCSCFEWPPQALDINFFSGKIK